jgi:hypothetical protein
MKQFSITEVGPVLKRIYDSEINIRIDWLWDGGYTWAIIEGYKEGVVPRVAYDDYLEGAFKFISITKDHKRDLNSPQFQNIDWIERGGSHDIAEAISQLAEAVARHNPGSDFEIWYKKISTDGPPEG